MSRPIGLGADIRQLEDLRARWATLGRRLNVVDMPKWLDVFLTVKDAYSQSHRKYHNLDHLHTGLKAIDTHAKNIASLRAIDLDVLRLAYWFHDFAYDIPDLGGVNEENSARAAAFHYSQHTEGKAQTAELVQAIKDTKACTSDTFLGQTLVSIDLGVLAWPYDRYIANYVAKVREEYGMFEDSLFYPERLRILEGLLAREAIYQHPWFRAIYEAPARDNLKKEVWAIKAHLNGHVYPQVVRGRE